jgi:hypothetical protein
MPRFAPPVLGLLLLAGPLPADEFTETVRPFLDRYCAACHAADKAKGELDLSPFQTQADAAKNPALWAGIAERLLTHEMPPPGSKQPPNDRRAKVVKWAQRQAPPAAACNTLATDRTVSFYRGHVMSRRLTRAEYDHTVRDLTGLDLEPSAAFPTDGAGGEGFDTTGDALFTSPIHVEQYLSAADRIVSAVWADPAARKRVLVAEPCPGKSPRDAATAVVAAFAERAFRRPVTGEEVDRLLTVFDKATARGEPWDRAVRLPLTAALISPHFLFLAEPEPDGDGGVVPLGAYPLASRLSYFLWGTMPDAELLHLAANGTLTQDDVLRGQVRRMLRDPKVRGLAESFALQWLDLRPLGTAVRPDPTRFPEFDDALAEAMRQEVVLLFAHVVREDRPLTEVIDADYAFVNDRLAELYGLPGVVGPELQKVALPNRTRGGAMTTAAVLTATSYPLRTSPVLRGKWLLNEVLGAKVPPPPPGAGELPKDDKSPDGLTFRQRLEQHRAKAECAACHARMDPLGFGLENYDPLGRWRTNVDATGQLPDGAKFDGPAELKALVLKRKPEFLRTLTRKLLGYALGRELNKFDQCVIDDAVKAVAADGDRAAVLFERVALSYPFRHRFVKK